MLPDPNEIIDNEVGHGTHHGIVDIGIILRKELHEKMASAISDNSPDDLLTDWNLEELWITLHPDHLGDAAPVV